MYGYLSAVSCLCILSTGLSAEECIQAIVAKRDTFYIPEGGSQSLSCVVQHCGDTWTGNWMWKNSSDEKLIKNSDRHHLTNITLSANETKLLLNFLKVNKSDEGSYGCRVTWVQGETDQGHWMEVNITAAVPTERILLHRFFVCASACICLPVILGLARCLSSEVKPPVPRIQSTHTAEYRDQPHSVPKPPPRRPVPKKRSKAPSQSEQRTEVVYADISQDALRQQGAIREPAHFTVYSAVKFS